MSYNFNTRYTMPNYERKVLFCLKRKLTQLLGKDNNIQYSKTHLYQPWGTAYKLNVV